ncbi:hypothetical protein [Nonomuraea sp. NPDC052265]|uniref:hypothetical protein n=1 Tax=Nonomuraea sp. NPDC052265 TaxID=3364374 RepID=UPI0037C84C87
MTGLPAVPEPRGARRPVHWPPALKRTVSPGWNVWALTLSRVLQAVDGECPSAESFPAGST